jgi:hypothetical protein
MLSMAMPLSRASKQHKATFLDIVKALRSFTPYKTLRHHTTFRSLDASPRSSAMSVHIKASGYPAAIRSEGRMKMVTGSDTFENSGSQKSHSPHTTTTTLLHREVSWISSSCICARCHVQTPKRSITPKLSHICL